MQAVMERGYTVDMDAATGEITRLLAELKVEPANAVDRLLPLVYDELKIIARRQRGGEATNRKRSATSIVHDAYLKLVQQDQVQWQSRAQFFFLASLVMRHLAIDHARHWQRERRAGQQVPLEAADLETRAARPANDEGDVLALEEALRRLATDSPRLAQVVTCRFYGGLNQDETAEALGLSPATVKRDWRLARAWLKQELHS